MSVSPIASTVVTGDAARLAASGHTRPGAASAFNAAALRNAPVSEQRKAVAAQFEAILVRQLLGKTMTSMLGGGEGVAGSVYGDMLTDTISQQLTAGPGLGLGRFIEQQLTPRSAAGHAAASDASSKA